MNMDTTSVDDQTNKRRRLVSIGDDESNQESNMITYQVVGSGLQVPTTNKKSCAQATKQVPTTIVPRLDEVSHLLYYDMQQNDLQQVEKAIVTLERLCDASQAAKTQAMRAGAHGILLPCLRRNIHSEAIQREGCGLLQSLMYQQSYAKELFAMVGAMEAIASALHSHPRSKGVQVNGLGALANLMASTSRTMDQVAHRFVHDLMGIPLILEPMRAFPNEEKIQASVCAILSNLSVHGDLREDMMQYGAGRAVAVAYEANRDSSTVQHVASNLMKQLE